MATSPKLYGIERSNRYPDALWKRDNFQSSFAVALTNYMRDRGMPLNYVTTDEHLRCRVTQIPVDAVYGCGREWNRELCFDFDTAPDPDVVGARGLPPVDLQVRGSRGESTSCLGVMVSVVPDASTKNSSPESAGPEMTLRTPSIAACAASIARGCRSYSDEALDILDPVCSGVSDWSRWDGVSDAIVPMVNAMNILERRFTHLQRPLVLHVLWRTDGNSPRLADEALDVFVWSDHSLSRLFMDRDIVSSAVGPNRPQRCTAKLVRAVHSILSGEDPCVGDMMDSMGYGIPNDRELMVNGRCTNRYLQSRRLTHPAVGCEEICNLVSPGAEDMLVPERRLDSSLYFAMSAMKG